MREFIKRRSKQGGGGWDLSRTDKGGYWICKLWKEDEHDSSIWVIELRYWDDLCILITDKKHHLATSKSKVLGYRQGILSSNLSSHIQVIIFKDIT